MDKPPEKRKPHWLVRRAIILLRVSAVVTAMTFLASNWWVADLIVNFRVQISIGIFALLLVVIASRNWMWVVAGLFLLFINAQPLIPYLVPRSTSTTDPEKTSWRLLTTNVLTSNRRYEDLEKLIAEEQPDLIVLMEINDRWAGEIQQSFGDRYPHQELYPLEHNFGIGLLSRHPWKSSKVHNFEPIQIPWLQTKFELDGKELELTAIHPLPPMNFENSEHRNNQLKEVSGKVDFDHSRIITGDFNMTPWSPRFSQFTNDSQTSDAARGFGVTRTWQVFPTIIGGLKIDHALMSDDLNVRAFRVGPDIGSDHRPIIVDFSFRDAH